MTRRSLLSLWVGVAYCVLRVGNERYKKEGMSRAGGRLSRRAADPVVEAERKAQQEKMYALDLDKVLSGAACSQRLTDLRVLKNA